jgi:Transmembrane domain of unknown function (DUF3566)
MVAEDGSAAYKVREPMSDPPGRTTVTTTAPRPRAVQATPQADGAKPRRWRRSRARQARVVIRKVRPWSVLKVSFFFYLCVMAVILGAFVILYGVLGAIGALDSVTKLIRDLFADQSFQIHGDWLFTRGVAVAFAMVILWTLINVFVTLLYNLISDVVGGIEVTLSERR